jgi:hypothetical protein
MTACNYSDDASTASTGAAQAMHAMEHTDISTSPKVPDHADLLQLFDFVSTFAVLPLQSVYIVSMCCTPVYSC